MNRPTTVSKCLVDGDIICYRSAAGTEGSPVEDTYDKVDKLMNYVVSETIEFPTGDNLEVFLTGKTNFRYEVAKTAEYKGHRKGVPKPTNLPAARDYLQSRWGAVMSVGEEADDLIGIASAIGDPDTTVVATVDKDMMQLPCWNYNFVTDTWVKVSEEAGNRFFYTQILTGDSADNIKGIHRVGPVKAGKILEGLTTEEELYKACVEAYQGDTERVLENARLLWLRRYPNEMWTPPNGS